MKKKTKIDFNEFKANQQSEFKRFLECMEFAKKYQKISINYYEQAKKILNKIEKEK